MRQVRVVNSRNERELGSRVTLADSWLRRLRGMLGRPAPLPGEGMLLSPCRSVHMYGMKFELDVAFLDDHGTVVACYPSLSPGSRSHWHRQAAHALELPAGALAESGTVVGDVLVWSSDAAPVLAAPSDRFEVAS
jgi:uncharacterized membrane protein (UPF0127 family)